MHRFQNGWRREIRIHTWSTNVNSCKKILINYRKIELNGVKLCKFLSCWCVRLVLKFLDVNKNINSIKRRRYWLILYFLFFKFEGKYLKVFWKVCALPGEVWQHSNVHSGYFLRQQNTLKQGWDNHQFLNDLLQGELSSSQFLVEIDDNEWVYFLGHNYIDTKGWCRSFFWKK